MKRKVIGFLAAALLTVTGTIAVAQQHMKVRTMEGGPSPSLHAELFATFLGLNDSQKATFNAGMQEFESTQQSLHAKQHDLEKQLHELLAGGTTDAAAVGTLVLQQRAIGDQIKAAHTAFEQKVMAILNPDQKVRAEALHAAMGLMHEGPGGPMMPREH
jgi:Spy/CpxP family protein refolding chaperone